MSVLSSTAGAQIQTVKAADSGTACSVAGSCAVFQLGNVPSATLSVAGTFSATLTFEATVDGQSWFAIGATKLSDGTTVGTTTGTGLFAFTNTGLAAIRARATSYSSGAADCVLGSGRW